MASTPVCGRFEPMLQSQLCAYVHLLGSRKGIAGYNRKLWVHLSGVFTGVDCSLGITRATMIPATGTIDQVR